MMQPVRSNSNTTGVTSGGGAIIAASGASIADAVRRDCKVRLCVAVMCCNCALQAIALVNSNQTRAARVQQVCARVLQLCMIASIRAKIDMESFAVAHQTRVSVSVQSEALWRLCVRL
jgi:hypothetical protein